MDIIYLSSSIIPSKTANSVHVMKMCNAFANNGHTVELFCREGYKKDFSDYEYYGVENEFKIMKAKHLGIRVLNSFWASYEYFRFLRNKKPDLLYGRDILSLFFFRNLRIKMVFEAHEPPKNKASYYIQKKVFQSSSFLKLVVISEALKKEYESKFKDLLENRIVVAHDGADEIDKKRIDENSENKFDIDKINVGYVGSLYNGRGIEIILGLADAFPNSVFHVIGGSEDEVKNWKSISNNQNIFFYGHVPPSEVQTYHARMDVLLAPYQEKVSVGNNKGDTSKYMSPLKIFEYMASGRPIMISDLPVLHEVLDDTSAVFVIPSDLQDWINKFNYLIDDKELMKSLGDNALQSFQKEYTWYARAKKLILSCTD